MTNLAPRQLVLIAYGVQSYQLAGGPGWMDSDRYDIQAKAGSDASVQQMEGPMLQALLEERFGLMLHRETRELPVYKLTIGKSAPKLRASTAHSCAPWDTSAPPPATTAGQAPPNFCGFRNPAADGLNRALDGRAVTMAALATTLSRSYTAALGRNVIDGTGITGTFDISLEWAMDAPAGARGEAGSATPQDSAGPSIFTALQEQLGLRLEPTRGPVEVLVIDHIEKPSGN